MIKSYSKPLSNASPEKKKSFSLTQNRKKTGFLRLSKDCDLLKSLTNRQKQFYLCLLWLSGGGQKSISNKFIRVKAQKILGIGWQAFYKMERILKEKKLIVIHKDISGKYLAYVNSEAINEKNFLLVPVRDKAGNSIFEKGFDVETYLNDLHRSDKYPTFTDSDQMDLFQVASRTRRHRARVLKSRKALQVKGFKGRQKSKAYIVPKGTSKTTKQDSKGFNGKINLCGTEVDWFFTKKLKIRGQALLAYRHKLFIAEPEKYHYRELTGKERRDFFMEKQKYLTKKQSRAYFVEQRLKTLRTLWRIYPAKRKQIETEVWNLRKETKTRVGGQSDLNHKKGGDHAIL